MQHYSKGEVWPKPRYALRKASFLTFTPNQFKFAVRDFLFRSVFLTVLYMHFTYPPNLIYRYSKVVPNQTMAHKIHQIN